MQAIVLLTEILKAGWPLWSKQALCASKSRKAAWPLWSKEAILVYRGRQLALDQCNHAANFHPFLDISCSC